MSSDERLTRKEKFELAVEAGLQLIPTIGGSLATIYFGNKQEKRFKRIESFYEEFQRELREIGYKFASIHSHDEDSLLALIEEFNERVEKEHTQEKRQMLKNYLRHTFSNPVNKENFDERRFFLDVLSQLSLLELELLAQLSKSVNFHKVGETRKPDVDQYAIVGAAGRLKTFGLIRVAQNTMVIGGNSDNALNESMAISSFGRQFVDYCLD
jgi:hypothetical protein